ncbi:MAG: MBL fold metallo-hydrolase [Verrucomicrobia bacterium]|nr:MBL fold metallo-hydrolase [Verrucomicrobiota bacterium]
MNLEDHAGDILRKARSSGPLTPEAAAALAGLTTAEYAALEDTGKAVRPPNFAVIASALGLSAPKLEKIYAGWLPAPVDLGQWRELRQITTSRGGNTVHCYLAWDEGTRDAAVFDTGFEAEPIIKLIAENELQLRHLFITHTHHDHIEAMEPLRQRFPQMRIHTDAKAAPPQHKNRRNDCVHVGSLRVSNRETTGHAEDGVTYLIGNWPEDAPHVAIVGDCLFAGSMGGARQLLDHAKQKVREQVFSLPPDTLICPGHGPLTTVVQEKAHNPFFQ